MKKIIDLIKKLLGAGTMAEKAVELQQLLGYHSRVPASLDEWYQPEKNRFYKKDQD